MCAMNFPGGMKRLEVLADGHLRSAQAMRQVLDQHAAFSPQGFQNRSSTFFNQHGTFSTDEK
jgi:hypothetical protein